MSSYLQFAQRLSLAVVGAWLWSLCFADQPRQWLPWLAVVPSLMLLHSRHPGRWGWLYGTVFWLFTMPWISPTLQTFGGLPSWLAAVCLVLMALYLGLFHAVFAVLGARLWQGSALVAGLGVPALWVVLEQLRGFPFGGFPWNLAAYAWVEVPGALPLAAWVGAWGVSWLLVLSNTTLALAWHRRRPSLALIGPLAALLLLPVAGRWSRPPPAVPLDEVRLLQPNFALGELVGGSYLTQYEDLLQASHQACDQPALLLWPESAAWPYTWQQHPHLRRDLQQLAAQGCPVILNTAWQEGEEVYNSALLVDLPSDSGATSGGGPMDEGAGQQRSELQRYDKRNLVPWGEHVPLGDLLPFVGKLARHAGDFTPGRDLGLLRWRDEQLGMAICYEVIFPGAMAEQVRAGATMLATVTNDAWYGDTAAPRQHFRAVRFRAAENRRPMLRAALTGISAIVDARGAVGPSLGVGERGTLRARVEGGYQISPFTRRPWLVPLLAWLVSVATLSFAILRHRIHRPRQDIRPGREEQASAASAGGDSDHAMPPDPGSSS